MQKKCERNAKKKKKNVKEMQSKYERNVLHFIYHVYITYTFHLHFFYVPFIFLLHFFHIFFTFLLHFFYIYILEIF